MRMLNCWIPVFFSYALTFNKKDYSLIYSLIEHSLSRTVYSFVFNDSDVGAYSYSQAQDNSY